MSNLDEIAKNIQSVGEPVLGILSNMKKDELVTKLKSILNTKELCIDILDGGDVHKTSINDTPEKIEIWYYGAYVLVNAIGIYCKPEHGTSTKIVEFNQHFKL